MSIKQIYIIIIGILTIGLTGCSAIVTSITHHNLEVSSRMSSTIFFTPEASENPKIIFVQARNSTDQKINIKSQIVEELTKQGYVVTKDIKKAYYMVQVNVLKIGKTNLDNINSIVNDGFGGAIVGGLIGSSGGLSGAGIGGLVGSLAVVTANALVEDVVYALVTDVQVSVRLPKGSQNTKHILSGMDQGDSTTSYSSYTSNSNWQEYKTRVISYAEKMNLKFDEALPAISSKLASQIASIFAN